MGEEYSEKTKSFIAALRELCVLHDVQLTTSAYDSLDAWDLSPGDDPVYANGIQDRTMPNTE